MSDKIVEKLIEIQKQNEIMINLLGKLVFKKDEVKAIVTYKKSNQKKYIDGYNACDGKHAFKKLVKIVGVTQGTLSPILQDWEEKGIVYSFEKDNSKFYKNYFKIEY